MKLIGTFNKQQVINGEDKKAVENFKQQNPSYKYVKTEFVKKKGEIVSMKVYLMTSEEYFNSKEI